MTELIQLISGPRNISTAMMYSFGNRGDTAIVDEPFYAHYLLTYNIEHPGRAETMSSMSEDALTVKAQLFSDGYSEDYLFIKNMAHHMQGYDYSYSYDVRNIFLIRDPKKLISSFAKVIQQPVAADLGLEREYELYEEIKMAGSQPMVVIDSGELLKDPPKVLRTMCDALEIPFNEKMLSWSPGPRAEDGVWAKYWYHSVHKSTCFLPQASVEVQLKDELLPLYEEVKPYYDKLFTHAIKA